MHYVKYFTYAAVLSCVIVTSHAHGRLVEPPSRASMWRYGFNTPIDYNDNQLYCGGFSVQWQNNGGKCGVCGDNWADSQPRAHEGGGQYGTGTIARTYMQGQTIDISVEITASHKGWFEFRLCPHNNPSIPVTQACLDQHLLEFTDGNTRVSGIESAKHYHYNVNLPADVTCTQCVLQWKYNTGNSWGVNPGNTGCLGCGPQEQFYGCADVTINPNETETSTLATSSTTTEDTLPSSTTVLTSSSISSPAAQTQTQTMSSESPTTTTVSSTTQSSTKKKKVPTATLR